MKVVLLTCTYIVIFFPLVYHYMLAKLNYDIVHLYVKTVLILILMLLTFLIFKADFFKLCLVSSLGLRLKPIWWHLNVL